ncbi:MAG: hypothetical protein QOD69_890 [Solirubrobacteraceae bacterium]|jgi:uncharacterized cupredoxin-like copper-binding protein|nr:hypothetical protein [Solirubrobacteraceae bacterium]
MPRLTAASAVLAASALVLGGCGGDATFRTNRPILRLQVDEYRIVPQEVVVKPGRVKFVVRNAGRLTHNLVIEVPPKQPDGKPVLVSRTETMQPGQTAPPIKVTLAPGEYRLVCTIANHDDLGQFGTLKVQR